MWRLAWPSLLSSLPDTTSFRRTYQALGTTTYTRGNIESEISSWRGGPFVVAFLFYTNIVTPNFL